MMGSQGAAGLVRSTHDTGNRNADVRNHVRSVCDHGTRHDEIETMMLRMMVALAAAVTVSTAAHGACPADALGTARVLTVDPAAYPRVGRKHFPQTLPLRPKEVVLTFDDGPEPGSTERVLDALKHECVKAAFFVLGRASAAHPTLVRRELSEGHTIAHHSFGHPILDRMTAEAAKAEIDHGFAAVDTALYGKAERSPVTPFFRFPGFASNQALLDHLERRQIAVFGADLWASDWNPMTPAQQLALVLDRLEQTRGGILLFHDPRAQTAAMLPAFLRALKSRGYSVVHVIPPDRRPGSAASKVR
jgi:peptidoglycan/xylan/chitin deacetylase (PgdA/CDA1 family)